MASMASIESNSLWPSPAIVLNSPSVPMQAILCPVAPRLLGQEGLSTLSKRAGLARLTAIAMCTVLFYSVGMQYAADCVNK